MLAPAGLGPPAAPQAAGRAQAASLTPPPLEEPDYCSGLGSPFLPQCRRLGWLMPCSQRRTMYCTLNVMFCAVHRPTAHAGTLVARAVTCDHIPKSHKFHAYW